MTSLQPLPDCFRDSSAVSGPGLSYRTERQQVTAQDVSKLPHRTSASYRTGRQQVTAQNVSKLPHRTSASYRTGRRQVTAQDVGKLVTRHLALGTWALGGWHSVQREFSQGREFIQGVLVRAGSLSREFIQGV
ncbi:hypothetical protein ACOMHN_009546 [Nucella lapillus]